MCFLAADGAATEVQVDCSRGKTIAWGLSKLDPVGPNTLRVTGNCQENVSIRGFSNLKILGTAGAEVSAALAGPATDDGGTNYVIEVVESSLVTIRGLAVHAGGGNRNRLLWVPTVRR